jgi:Tfp pilus assembly protein PilE
MRRLLHPLGQAGFTPVEALIATAAGLLAISAFASFNTAQMYALRTQAKQTDLQSAARSIVDLFAREVRRAGTGTNPNCTGTDSTGIVTASSTSLRIRADLNNTGYTLGPNEDVIYTLDYFNDAVKRTDVNSSWVADTLWSGALGGGWTSAIAGSQFLYYDSNGNQLAAMGGLSATQLTQVVRIKLELALTAKGSQPGNSMLLTAKDSATVDLRNRYFLMVSRSASGAICGPIPQTNPLSFYR